MRADEEKKTDGDGSMGKVSSAGTEDEYDFGGEKSLPPTPKLTAEEEKKLYRKIDLRRVLLI